MNVLDFKNVTELTLTENNLDVLVKNFGTIGDMVSIKANGQTVFKIVEKNGFIITVPIADKDEFDIVFTNLTHEEQRTVKCVVNRPMMMRTMRTLREAPKSVAVNDVIVIDPESRTITVPMSEEKFGTFSERNVERKYFECPRIILDNIDLSKYKIFVNYISVGGKPGQYLCEDVHTSEDGQNIEFSWLLSGNLFDENKAGTVFFAVQAKTTDGNSVFCTSKAQGTVGDTVDEGTYIEKQNADVILQIIARLDNLEGGVIPQEKIDQAVERYFRNHPVSSVPTRVSQLQNDLRYQTDTQVSQTVANAIKNVKQFEIKKVSVLPVTGQGGIIYIVPNNKGIVKNIFDEYVWVDNSFEFIGTGQVDLSQYAKKVDIPVTLPSPYSITFTGAVQGTYNGSEALTVNIPQSSEDIKGDGLKSPKDFGAKADGGTDDTVVVQQYAQWCKDNKQTFYTRPNEVYKVTTVNIDEVHSINSQGSLKGNVVIRDFSSQIGHSSNVFINKVETLELQGFNSAFISVLRATTMKLIAKGDTTADPNHFIGYNTFRFGYIKNLEINVLGQEAWINENLFTSGRFETLTMDSVHHTPENNVFFKCMSEHSVFNIKKGRGNQWIDCRLEGAQNGNIKFGDETYGNVIQTSFNDTKGKFFTRGVDFHKDTSVDYMGANKLEINPHLNIYPLIAINENNNTNNLTVADHKLQCGKRTVIYESKIVEVPRDPFCIMYRTSELALLFGLKCYDSNMTPVTIQPKFVTDSPTVGWASWENSFGNVSNSRDTYWIIVTPQLDVSVKYVSLWCKNDVTPIDIKEIEFIATSYADLPQAFVYGLSHLKEV